MTKFFKKIKKSYFWFIFCGKDIIKNPALAYTTPHEPLTPCWISKKLMSQLQKNFGLKGQTDPKSQGPSGQSQMSNKRISQLLRGIAVDSKNKTQHN